MKQLGIVIIIIYSIVVVTAQQIPMFSNYSTNLLMLNPAYAGSKKQAELNMLNRNQWVGFDGAPTSQAFNVHTPIKYRKIGLGLTLLQDKIGPLSSTSTNLNFSYKIRLSKLSTLALGIKGGGTFFKGNLAELKTIQEEDPLLLNETRTLFVPNFGTGAYFYYKQTFLGLASPHLLVPKMMTNGRKVLYNLRQHFFFMGGTQLDVNESIQFVPSFMVRYVLNVPLEVELTSIIRLKEKYELGIAYRTTDAVIALLGIQLIEKVRLGYSFDWSFSNTTFRYNQGSHEIYLNYTIPRREKVEEVTPRYL